jgi:uncharacterized membrane protein YgcG
MGQNTVITQRQMNIPPIVWCLGIGLVIALIAIFVFKVAVGTAAYYGLLVVMIGGHFFMHTGHSGHGRHGGSGGHQRSPKSDAVESDRSDTNKHSGHPGGCH